MGQGAHLASGQGRAHVRAEASTTAHDGTPRSAVHHRVDASTGAYPYAGSASRVRLSLPVRAGMALRSLLARKIRVRGHEVPLAVPLSAALVLTVALVVSRCTAKVNNQKAGIIAAEVAEGHAYDWNLLNTTKTGWTYSDSTYESTWGVDVSSYQGDIDWSKVKADGAQFAMIRVGYRGYGSGAIVEDSEFQSYAEGAADAGLDVGFYFFSQAISTDEAREEARYVIERIRGYQTEYPVVFDMENASSDGRIANLTTDQRTAIAKAFCEEVTSEGYYPMVYGNEAWLTESVDVSALGSYPLWLAAYEGTPDFPQAIQMWQYSENAKVSGISGGADLDICFLRKQS